MNKNISVLFPIWSSLTFLVMVLLASPVLAQGKGSGSNSQPLQVLQAQITELHERLALLENNTIVSLSVDCAAGESLGEAIAAYPVSVPLEITLSGQCAESVLLLRDDVTIQGATPADGLVTPTGTMAVIAANGSSRIFLKSLTIDNATGGAGVGCYQQSHVQTENVRINGGATGYSTYDGGQCQIINGVIDGAITGVSVGRTSHADLEGTTVINSGSTGVNVQSGGNVTLQPMQFTSTLIPTVISSSGHEGVHLAAGSHAEIQLAHIVDNGGIGVLVNAGSTVRIVGAVQIQGNSSIGVFLRDNSTGQFGTSGTGISDNGTWDILCSNGSVASGNPAGAAVNVNCN